MNSLEHYNQLSKDTHILLSLLGAGLADLEDFFSFNPGTSNVDGWRETTAALKARASFVTEGFCE